MENVSIFPEIDYVVVRSAIEILLNNGCLEAKAFLAVKRNESSLLSAAASFVDFLGSLLSLDENDINNAIINLKETQRFCEAQRNILREKKSDLASLECVMNEILTTDAELFIAILTILKQGVKDYVKGVYMIRKAWKQYKKNFQKVLKLGGCFLKCSLDSHSTVQHSQCPPQDQACGPLSRQFDNSHDVDSQDAEDTSTSVTSLALLEVRAAIAFGYGLFHLVVSFVPPKFLSFVQIFGFAGNQELGLLCLTYVCHSQDVKAELSRLGLLWFHAIVRPVYALDDNDVFSGLHEASELLRGLNPKLLVSPVGLYFEGLLFRCKGNFRDATKSLELALEKPIYHKEIFMFCDYEIGWCHLLDMKWDLAVDAFRRVKDGTAWSKCFYVYLIGVILGLQGNLDESLVYIKYVPSLVKRRTPLGIFLIRKANFYIETLPQKTECLLLLLEIVYLWECLPTCSMVTLSCFLDDIQKPVRDKFVQLNLFLMGYLFQRLGHIARSVECYTEASSIDRTNWDSHIKPFALYELGITSARMAQFDKGQQYLKRAKEVPGGYDFENRLKLKTDIAIKKLQERSKKVSGNC